MKKLLSIVVLLTLGVTLSAQVVTPFRVRKSVTQKGGIVFLSNTSSKAVPDNVVQNEMPPSGTGYDNNFTNGYVDIDGDGSTFMSSSDQLSLPNCSEITWAGLYWGADCSSGDENYATRDRVKLKVNNGAYIDLTADYKYDNTVGFRTYHCFKDVTSILKANGLSDRYTVANVATDIGGKNLFGGWSIVVIYKNSTQTMRNLTVFEGLASVSAGTYSTVDIPISGFQTPLAGPVTLELGLIAYDGDRSLTGDQLMFKGATSFVNISDALHSTNDVFNSTLSRKGALTPLRNPSYNNTLGYDANIFAPDNSSKNYIGNNAISATIRQTTGGETYLTQVVTSAIDVYEPDLRSAVRVKNITHPGTTVAEKGDILEYTVNGLNIGSDPSVNTFITDTIEGNAEYIPNSIIITYGPNSGAKSDAAGDDQAEYIASAKAVKVRIGTGANGTKGGLVNNSPVGTDSTQFRFRVKASSDCVFLACDAVIDNSAFITGTGNVSGNTFDNASNPGVFDAFGCTIPGTTKTPINITGCSAPTASANSPICAGGSINFTASESPSASYLWTGPNSFTSTLREPVITNVTAVNAGAYTANIFITGKTCHFVYSFNAEINIANAGPDQTNNLTCGLTTVTLAGNSPAGTNGTWSIVSGTGGSFGAGHTATSTVPNTTFNGVAGNSYTLRWSLNSVGCDPTSDDVNISFNQGPSASVLSGSSSICYNGYPTLKAVITGGVAPYTVVLDNGGGTFTGYASGNDLLVGPLTTSKTFGLVSVTDVNGCLSTGLSGSANITASNAITGSGIITQLNPPASGGGPKTAGTSSSTAWSNTTNTTASDNSYSTGTLSSGGNSNYLYLSNFGFSIPAGATITGVEAVIERAYTTTGTRTISSARISLQSNTTLIGSNQTISYPANTDATLTVGGSANMWGATTATLTPAIVNNSNFGVRCRVTASSSGSGNVTARIDYVTLKIYYTPAAAYCDDVSGTGFSVATYTNATSYIWSAPSGGSVTSGQGTSSVVMDFNGAGQNGNYNVCVTASNNCQSLAPSCLSIPITDCANTGLYIIGNIYWDKNAMTDNLVNGTPVNSANGTQLYATLVSGTTAALPSVAVAANGTYKFAVSASTAYTVVLSTTSYLAGQTPVASLPAGCTNTGEIVNNITNTLTGSDGTADGRLAVAGFTTNNKVNVNFGIKISTPPVAANDVTTTNEDTPITVNVTTNDTDVDGTVTVSTVDLNPSLAGVQTSFSNMYGSWSVNASGVVTFTPVLNFNGIASTTYVVNDNDGNTSNVATIQVTVNPVNDAPVTVDDAATTTEDTPVSVNVLSNDSDIDGTIDLSTVDLNTSVAGIQNTITVNGEGTYVVNSSGVVTFTPVLNYNGTATPVAYRVNDNNGATSSSAYIRITVTSVIDAPIATDDNFTTDQNVAVSGNITSNDQATDAALDVTSVDLDPATPGIQSDITVSGEGSYHVSNTGLLTFTPPAVFYGNTTPLPYTIKDNLAQVSNIGYIKIIVLAASAPVANNDAASTNEGSSVTITIASNDSAPNGSLNLSRVDLDPSTDGIQQSLDIPDEGTYMVDINGIVTFQPAWGFNGTSIAHYTIKDNLGLTSNVATITVTVLHVNQPPVAVDDYITTNEDTPVIFNVLTNDYDNDGSLAVNSVDLDPSVAARQTTFTVTGEGTYTVDNSGNVTFAPVLNFNGNATPVYYTVNDNQGLSSSVDLPGQILVTVNPVNDAPKAVNDIITGPSNNNIEIAICSNDTDVDGSIDPSSVDLDTSFPGIQKTFTVAGEGTYNVDNSGLVTFDPLPAFIGPVNATPVSYQVYDNLGAVSNTATITITITDPSAPVAFNDSGTTTEDSAPVAIDFLTNDVNGTGTIDVASIDLNPATPLTHDSDVTNSSGRWQANIVSGSVTFTPALNFNGTASINYIIYDNNTIPLASNTATITVTVTPVNDVPSFAKGADQTVCTNSDLQTVSGWATNLSAGPADESGQILSFAVTNNNNALFSTQPAISSSGTLTFKAASSQSGSATVTVRISDNGGTADGGVDTSPAQTFTITVNSPAPPVPGTITQPTCAVNTGSVVLSGLPASGIWILTPSTGAPVSGTGTSYTLSGLSPSTVYSFTATNSSGCVSSASSNVSVSAVPSPPSVPSAASVTSPTCSQTTGSIVFNTQTGVQYSVGGAYQASTTFTNLTPGTYTLYVRNTGDNTCITQGAATVTIASPPAPPSAPTAASVTSPGCSQTTGSIVFNTQSGVLYSVGGSYQASPTFTNLIPGTYTLYVRSTVDNSCITQSAATVTITSAPAVPSAPTAPASQGFCSAANARVSNLTVTGTGIIWYTAASGGSVVASSTALVTGTTYYASQTSGGCESTTRTGVTVTILACSGPSIADHSLNLYENTVNGSVVYDINDINTGTDFDIDGNPITYSIISGNAMAGFALDPATGIITVADVTKIDYEIKTFFNIGVSAGNGSLTDDAVITITIFNLNDNAPVAANDSYSVDEGAVLTVAAPGVLTNDSDADGNTLTASKVSDPLHGVLIFNSDGSFTYTNYGDESSTDSFTYNVSDGVNTSNTATVTLNIYPVNDPPVVADVSRSANEDNIITFTLADFTGKFTDAENHALTSVKIISLPANGVLKLSGAALSINSELTPTDIPNLTFTPDLNWNGSTSFGWNGSDGTVYASTPASVLITINPVNDIPVVSDFSKSVNEDATLSFTASDFTTSFSDADGNSLTKIIITALPANGKLQLNGVDVQVNDEIAFSDIGALRFIPASRWNGTTTFTWNGFDGTSFALTDATVTIVVAPVNSAPVVSNFSKTVNEDQVLSFTASDFTGAYNDADTDPLTKIKITGLPLNGKLMNGNTQLAINDEISAAALANLVFEPNSDWNGTTSFSWNASDGTVYAQNDAVVNITVTAVNDSPVIIQAVIRTQVNENSAQNSIVVLANVTDVDSNSLTVSIVTASAHGTSSVNSSGEVVYSPATGYYGNDTITYRVCDNGTPALCVTGKIIITVIQTVVPNHIPVIQIVNVTTVENKALSFTRNDFLSKYSDSDNDTLVRIQNVSLPASGTLNVNGTTLSAGDEISWQQLSQLQYIPMHGFSGNDSFSWKASDGKDYSISSDVEITVTPEPLFIPEGFSPNGDGVNDFFVINGIDNYTVSISIYNRWGNLVYSSKNYKNDWDGLSNSGLLIGSKLPDGTYFYVINLNNGDKARIGNITINR